MYPSWLGGKHQAEIASPRQQKQKGTIGRSPKVSGLPGQVRQRSHRFAAWLGLVSPPDLFK
jgi:hypothetical protein